MFDLGAMMFRAPSVLATFLLVLGLSLATAPAGSQEHPPIPQSPPGERPDVERALDIIERDYWQPDWVVPMDMAVSAAEALEQVDPRLVVSVDGQQIRMELDELVETRSVAGIEDVRGLEVWVASLLEWAAATLQDEDGASPPEHLERQVIRGMLGSLDRFSSVLPAEDMDSFNARFKGTLAGIGARVGRRDGNLRILKPFPDSPAEQAGLMPGDVIEGVDGISTTNMRTDDAVQLIRGTPGTVVVLGIQRPGEERRRVFPVLRAKVLVPSVESRMLTENIGLITIDHFSRRTSDEFGEHLRSLAERNEVSGLVLDLRGNTGGSLRNASQIVNAFVREGLLVETQGAGGKVVRGLTHRIVAEKKHYLTDLPLVTLVDSSTASGAEIVSAALKFGERSLIIGSQTYGKGTVQKVFKLPSGDSLKLTVARYLVLGDRWIHDVGVTPDVEVGRWILRAGNEREQLAGRIPDRFNATREEREREGVAPLITGPNALPHLWMARPVICASWRGDATDEQPEVWWRGFGPEPLCDGADDGDDRFGDLETRTAVEILEALPEGMRVQPVDRSQLLELAEAIVQEADRGARERLANALAQRSVDWSSAEHRWLARVPAVGPAHLDDVGALPAELEVTWSLPEPVEAGQSAELQVRAHNRGNDVLHHLRAVIDSSHPDLRGVDVLIGDLEPGAQALRTHTVEFSMRLDTRKDDLRVLVLGDEGALGAAEGTILSVGLPGPRLSMRTRHSVSEQGDDRGALWAVDVEVRNDGEGPSGDLQVYMINSLDRRVTLLEDEVPIPALGRGDKEGTRLHLRLRDVGSEPYELSLRVIDRDKGASTRIKATLDPSRDSWSEWLTPPRIEVPGSDRALEGHSPWELRASVRDPEGVRSVTLYGPGHDRLARWSSNGSAKKRMQVATSVELEDGINVFRLVAEDGSELTTEHRIRVWSGSAEAVDGKPSKGGGSGPVP
jgi:carboxyl-terminal processing protease